MNRDELIQSAVAAIGSDQVTDYKLTPTTHAAALGAPAAALGGVLRGSNVLTSASDYERKDLAAIKAQTVFKKVAERANLAVFITAILSTGIFVVPFFTRNPGVFLVILGCAGVVSGALGSMWLFEIRQGNLFQEWMNRRASAEMERLKYFECVTQPVENAGVSEVPLSLLQLEYFRRYQLEVQRLYYSKRSEDHKDAANKLLTASGFAAGLSAIATGLAGILGAVFPNLASVAGLGTIGTALSAFVTAKEALGQHRRNQELYEKTNDALSELARRLDEVRSAAASGDQVSLKKFVTAVHEQLSVEHKQWLDASENVAASLAELEKALSQAKLNKADANGKPIGDQH